MTSSIRRLRYFNNHTVKKLLTKLLQVKRQFHAFGNHGFRKPETMVSGSLKRFWLSETMVWKINQTKPETMLKLTFNLFSI